MPMVPAAVHYSSKHLARRVPLSRPYSSMTAWAAPSPASVMPRSSFQLPGCQQHSPHSKSSLSTTILPTVHVRKKLPSFCCVADGRRFFRSSLSSRKAHHPKQNASASAPRGEVPIDRIRNIGIIAHIDAGKTTTIERMLYYAGYTRSIGDVDAGSTVTDYLPAERERGITITAACIPLLWRSEYRVNLVDTPGHVDFTLEVERSLRVLDGAVVVLDGVAGCEAQTETVWRQADRTSLEHAQPVPMAEKRRSALPRIVFVNKMDREGAALGKAVRSLGTRLGIHTPGLEVAGEIFVKDQEDRPMAVVVQWPVVLDGTSSVSGIGSGGPAFGGVVDLIELKVLEWVGETGSVMRASKLAASETNDNNIPKISEVIEGGISADLQTSTSWLRATDTEKARLWTEVKKMRMALVEALATVDESVVEAFIELEDHVKVPADVLRAALRRTTLKGIVIPVLCGAAFRNMGVQPLMDAVVDYLPSPAERPSAVARIPATNGIEEVRLSDSRFCALAFKVVHDAKRGPLVFIRVYSGAIDSRSVLYNSSRNVKERAAKLLQMYADDFEDIPRLTAGNIACIAGLATTRTGDTLLSAAELPNSIKPDTQVQLDTIRIPPPVFVRSVEAETTTDERKLSSALAALVREDPSLQVTVDEESSQTLISGMGELHLEIAGDRLRDTHGCRVRLGKVTISYRETVDPNVGAVIGQCEYNRELFGKRSKVFVEVSISSARPTASDEGMDGIVKASYGDKDTNYVTIDRTLWEGAFPEGVNLHHPDSSGGGGKGSGKNPRGGIGGKPWLSAPPGYPSIRELSMALEEGIRSALNRGALLGFPLAAVSVNCIRLELASPELTTLGGVKAAASRAVSQALAGGTVTDVSHDEASSRAEGRGVSRLMEPIMQVTIQVPAKYVGVVTRDLTGSRRGHVVSLEDEGVSGGSAGMVRGTGTAHSQVLTARVPLGSLVGYSTVLRGLTAGNESFSMRLLGYGIMDLDREEGVVKEIRGF
ncbi:P-loop containing nucleoside triphosphate hydrolase protein [Zopfochytrium polystomum]|nr:P-loop containing nucleoside triphosphate hydrolase protein [Zopfochytrium polystomum]